MSNISVITPSFSLNNSPANLCITDADNVNIVCYEDSENYTIIHKDGGIPDITLDKTTVNLLLKARFGKQCLKFAEEYFKKHTIIETTLLAQKNNDSKKLLGELISKILTEDCNKTDLQYTDLTNEATKTAINRTFATIHNTETENTKQQRSEYRDNR